VGQGLSGTLDMQTVRPLNFDNRVVALNARVQNNSLGSAGNADANGNRFSVSYVDQFANRTLGVLDRLFAFLHSRRSRKTRSACTSPGRRSATTGALAWPAGTFYTDGIKALRRTGNTKRDGVMAHAGIPAVQ
jgi:hypothetical protein